MIESLLSTLQFIVSWLWGCVVNVIPMPLRGSLAVALVAYFLPPFVRVSAPWLLIVFLSLVRGVCWLTPRLLLCIEGVASNLLEKAGGKFTRALDFFSGVVVISFGWLDGRSRSLIDKTKSFRKGRRPLGRRLALLLMTLAAAPILFIYYSPYSTRTALDVVPPSLAWWHSIEHFLLSGDYTQKHVEYTVKGNKGCLSDSDCLLNEASRYGKISAAELQLDNPDKLPSLASVLLIKIFPERSPKPGGQNKSLLIPVRFAAAPSISRPGQVSPTPRARR